MKLTEREIELIDGMIEVQLRHAEHSFERFRMPNTNPMFGIQYERDMERVELLRKIKEQLS